MCVKGLLILLSDLFLMNRTLIFFTIFPTSKKHIFQSLLQDAKAGKTEKSKDFRTMVIWSCHTFPGLLLTSEHFVM